MNGRQQLCCGQPYLIGHGTVAGNGHAGRRGCARVEIGELPGGGQAHLVGQFLTTGNG